MRKLRLALSGMAVAATTVAAVGFSAAPAHAFPCPTGTSVNTGQLGLSGIATIQVCSEAVRFLPTGELTTVVQVGVELDGQEVCVVVGRIIFDIDPPSIPTWDTRGLFGTPLFLSCPGS